MDKHEMLKAIEEARAAHLKEREQYRSHYQSVEELGEGFAVLIKSPEDVQWELEDTTVRIKGHVKGLQELTCVMQAFSHDPDTFALLHEQFVLLKSHEPITFEGLVVVAMPDRAWEIWGGKMGDIAFGYDGFDELSFNQLGFYEEQLPIDIGIRITSGKELLERK